MKYNYVSFEKSEGDGAERPGRPREDRFQRQMEIYHAVAPLIMELGARRLSMKQAADAARISVGGLYHYFDSKRDLMVFPLLPGVCQEALRRFRDAHEDLRREQPRRYLDLYIQRQAEDIQIIRPAVKAAVELGDGDFWEVVNEDGIEADLREFIRAVRRVMGNRHDPERLASAIRREMMSAALDHSVTTEEVRSELHALIDGVPMKQP